MSTRPRSPRTYTIIRTYEKVAGVHRVVPVREALYQLAVDKGASVAALVMRAQRIRKGSRRGRCERRGKRPRRSFRKQPYARLEPKGRLRQLVIAPPRVGSDRVQADA